MFATKRSWFLRPTVKLDPVAEFFFYEFIYRNRPLFRKSPVSNRTVYGYRIVGGSPIPILSSYSEFKKGIAGSRSEYEHHAYFDVGSYFNRIYHHDLVAWFESAGGAKEDVELFSDFLRETSAGRSVDCLPQGIYPAKMVGSAFLGFLENSNRLRSARSVRMMDDIWLFDDEPKTVIADFVMAQSLLSDRGLTINEEKSTVLEQAAEYKLPPDLDEVKIELLQKRREELSGLGVYGDTEEEDDELYEISEEEQEYLLSLLQRDNVQEEDAELVLTLMQDHSSDVVKFVPSLITDFPGLSKRLYHFCRHASNKAEVAETILAYLKAAVRVTEYQLFWFGMMVEDYLPKTPKTGELLIAIYEHENATDITKAKILEIPEKRFGLADLREEQLRTGHSDWLAWASAVGAHVHPKAQRNHLLKYFRKSSGINQLIGSFVANCF